MPLAFAAAPALHRPSPSLPLRCPHARPHSPLPVAPPPREAGRHARRTVPRARLFDSRNAYRRGSLLATKSRIPSFAPAPAPAPAPPPPLPRPDNPRYAVRSARLGELYTVADIRCEAFYGAPTDMYYYPVRRREIYMAMRDRLASGNRCLVVVDKDPPADWRPFANDDGHLVVGSLDVSMHGAATGRRVPFGDCLKGEGSRFYISSMAVRDEWQRRGLARRLLKHVDQLAVEFAVGQLFLHVEWENIPAVSLYSECGFVSTKNDDPALVPKWLQFLAKREHTLMRKRSPK